MRRLVLADDPVLHEGFREYESAGHTHGFAPQVLDFPRDKIGIISDVENVGRVVSVGRAPEQIFLSVLAEIQCE